MACSFLSQYNWTIDVYKRQLFDRLPIGHPAKGPYSLFSQASDTVRAGIVLGLGTRLQVLQSEVVRRITRSPDIDLSEPGWSKCAYYIILEDQNSSLEFLSALFFAFLFIKLVRYADSTPEQRCNCLLYTSSVQDPHFYLPVPSLHYHRGGVPALHRVQQHFPH